jgi:tRNA-modifying protein YgfZ
MPTQLSHLRAIQISGADAASFLQSQLTSDVSALSTTRPQLSAWCKPNGRIGTLGWLFLSEYGIDSGFSWFVPARSAEASLRQLSLFKLRAKVSLQLSPLPVCDAGPFALPDGRRLGASDSASLDLASENRWLLADIAKGWPSLGDGERFLPQMLGLERAELAGLSLKKGCFPGQEVIARVHYKGEVKRTLARYIEAAEQLAQHEAESEGVEVLQQAINLQQKLEVLAVVSKPAPAFVTLVQQGVTRRLREALLQA